MLRLCMKAPERSLRFRRISPGLLNFMGDIKEHNGSVCPKKTLSRKVRVFLFSLRIFTIGRAQIYPRSDTKKPCFPRAYP